MNSWIMRSWLERHDESEWPDLTICQTEDACHLIDMKSHPSKEVIEKMCSDEFSAKHKYKYVDDLSVTVREDEGDLYSYCREVGNSEASEGLDISPNYEVAYISCNAVERGHKFMAINHKPGEQDGNESDYLCPVAMEAEQRSDTEPHSSTQGTTEGFGNKRSHTEVYQAEAVSRTSHEDTFSLLFSTSKVKKRVVEYKNIAFSSDQDEASWDEDAESIPDYDTPRVAYENAVYILDQGHTSQNEGHGSITTQEACPDEYDTMEGDSLVCLYQNGFTCVHPTVSDQLVPQNEHLYANMQEEEVDVVFQDIGPLLGTETGQPQDQETLPQLDQRDDIIGKNSARGSERYPIAHSWLKKRKVEVTFDI